MKRNWIMLLSVLTALLLTGCGLRTVEQMYALPKRSEAYSNLQSAIDMAMTGLAYAAPDSGEHQQTVQQADLDGDGQEEYLLFAQDPAAKVLKILIFDRVAEQYTPICTIDTPGFAFEQVEYVCIDDRPGVELVVGCRVSDRLLRNLTVYTFADGEPVQLMNDNCFKFLTCDLNADLCYDVVLFNPGETEADRGVAVFYRFENGQMHRSRQVDLSGAVQDVKRIMVSNLESGETAVYVASSQDETAIITDIFAVKAGRFANISFSSESETSVQTLRNYYIYADDIDNDGILELPSLIHMTGTARNRTAAQEYLIRWYSMDLDGSQTDKLYTYHNFSGGWYLELTAALAERIFVTQDAAGDSFWVRTGDGGDSCQVLTIYTLVGPNREDQALENGRFVLYRGDGVLYAASLEEYASQLEITQDDIINRFHLIRHDWKTGET